MLLQSFVLCLLREHTPQKLHTKAVTIDIDICLTMYPKIMQIHELLLRFYIDFLTVALVAWFSKALGSFFLQQSFKKTKLKTHRNVSVQLTSHVLSDHHSGDHLAS